MRALLILAVLIFVDGSSADDHNYYSIEDMLSRWEDTSEFWRATELLTLLQRHLSAKARPLCELDAYAEPALALPTRRRSRPVCRGKIDEHACPQCPRLSNHTTCELFRDSCRERRVTKSEGNSYCDMKYGRWRTALVPADYSQCSCCDECVPFRELHQTCVANPIRTTEDEDFLPYEDLRAGCNPYKGHSEEKYRKVVCDRYLNRCVPNASVDNLKQLRRGNAEGGLTTEALPGKPCGEECDPGCRGSRRCLDNMFRRDGNTTQDQNIAEEPCKREMRRVKEMYGPEGHLHHSAPQCTPLWLYGPVQCRAWVCYCALEDGSPVTGVKVPRSEASKMYCDCARDKCRTGTSAKCDGFGNYATAEEQPLI